MVLRGGSEGEGEGAFVKCILWRHVISTTDLVGRMFRSRTCAGAYPSTYHKVFRPFSFFGIPDSCPL